MAKQSFTSLFDNMPTVDAALSSTEAKKTADKTLEEEEPLSEQDAMQNPKTPATKNASAKTESETGKEEKKPANGALPFLKEQRNTEKKNQTFYIPVYLQERLKESAEMYNMTVSGVLTEILKSVYQED